MESQETAWRSRGRRADFARCHGTWPTRGNDWIEFIGEGMIFPFSYLLFEVSLFRVFYKLHIYLVEGSGDPGGLLEVGILSGLVWQCAHAPLIVV